MHPEIANPDYKEDKELYRYDNIGAVGFDLWQVKSGSIFDNVIVTDSVEKAEEFSKETWAATTTAEKAAKEALEAAEKKAEEEKRAAEEEKKGEGEGEQEEEAAEDVEAEQDEALEKDEL